MNGTSDEDDISEYEKLRLRRIEENQKFLFDLGLTSDVPTAQPRLKAVNSTPKLIKKKCQSIATPVPAQRIVKQRPIQSDDQYHVEPIKKKFKKSEEDDRKKIDYTNQKDGKNVGVRKEEKNSGRNFTSQPHKIGTGKEGSELRKRIEVFFENDSVSRICPSKKEYSQGLIKKKKRLLLDDVKHLYRRFLNESGCSLSFSMFQWLKPFWVVQPSVLDDENLSIFVKHSNFTYMLSKLKKLSLIDTENVNEFLKKVSCDIYNPTCMMDRCVKCKNCSILMQCKFKDKEIMYETYKLVFEERIIRENKKQIGLAKKVVKTCFISDLIKEVSDSVPEMKKHVYFTWHQQNTIEITKRNLKKNEVMIVVGFPDNYVCKTKEDIQMGLQSSRVFKKQLSVHTGVIYYKNTDEKDCLEHQSFATVSDNLDHEPLAVWAHLKPVILQIEATCKQAVKTVHFFSDSNRWLYRNKKNICYMLKNVPSWLKQLEAFTWNFCELRYGGGPIHGIATSLKRQADNHVLHFSNILTASAFVKIFEERLISVLLLKEEDVIAMEQDGPSFSNAPVTSDIVDCHKISWTKKSSSFIRLWPLSCFSCPFDGVCNHFSPVKSIRFNYPAEVEDSLDEHGTIGVEDFLDKAEHNEQPSRDSCMTEASIVKDSWVVAVYDSLWYPGKVEEVNLNTQELTISFMKPNRQYFVWPSRKDEQKLKINEILCQIDPPYRKSARCFTICEKDIGKIERFLKNFKLDELL